MELIGFLILIATMLYASRKAWNDGFEDWH